MLSLPLTIWPSHYKRVFHLTLAIILWNLKTVGRRIIVPTGSCRHKALSFFKLYRKNKTEIVITANLFAFCLFVILELTVNMCNKKVIIQGKCSVSNILLWTWHCVLQNYGVLGSMLFIFYQAPRYPDFIRFLSAFARIIFIDNLYIYFLLIVLIISFILRPF